MIRLWHLPTTSVIWELDNHKINFNSLAFNLSGQLLAAASSDCLIYVWDVRDGTKIHQLRGHEYPVLVLARSCVN